jgi:3-oxoacyl-[acyl-carrier-protein] synthase III
MNGVEVYHFASRTVPSLVTRLVQQARISLDDVDVFVFHQASKFILDALTRALGVSDSKVLYAMSDCGNTGSCSIPIALKRGDEAGILRNGARVAIVGFGSGYSWSSAMVRWHRLRCRQKVHRG